VRAHVREYIPAYIHTYIQTNTHAKLYSCMLSVKVPNTIKEEITFTFVKVTTNSESTRVIPKVTSSTFYVNPLNAELNPICHLLVLLGDLTFMGPCILSIFQYTCISNNMQRYTVYLYLETVLHVSGGISTHHQKRIQLYLQHLVLVTPLLLSAAIVEEVEPV
jgi:hypothetical protein